MMTTSFTAEQRKELELQGLIFNYVVLGIPIPAYLLYIFRTSFLSTSNPVPLPRVPSWIRQQPAARFDRKEDGDVGPWRCHRMDGKKWRCPMSKLVASNDYDFKYCERHLHRGSNMCPRKRVALTPSPPAPTPAPAPLSVLPNLTGAFKFPIPFSMVNTLGAFPKQDDARGKKRVCPLPTKGRIKDDDNKADRHCLVMGVDLIKAAEMEKKTEEKRYIYLFNKCIEVD